MYLFALDLIAPACPIDLADVEDFIYAAEADPEALDESLEMSATYHPLLHHQSSSTRRSPVHTHAHSMLSTNKLGPMMAPTLWQVSPFPSSNRQVKRNPHAACSAGSLRVHRTQGLANCEYCEAIRRCHHVTLCCPTTDSQGVQLHCKVAEARKAVSASMTAEGMRQQNEALRWALRASSLACSGHSFQEAGDESTLFTGSDESVARSTGATGGALLSAGICHIVPCHLMP